MLQMLSIALAVALTLMTVSAVRRHGGSTLRAPLVWATFACLTLGGLACWQSALETPSLPMQATLYTAGVVTLCPIMAVLGAKRPQHRGWQWVVATMCLVAVWPAVQAVALPVGPRLELFVAWRIFLWGLILLGPLNYLATRFWLASLFTAAGQIVLLSPYLGLAAHGPWQLPTSLGMFVLATIAIVWRGADTNEDALSRRWLHFRDSFGAFWALRIQQRVNQTAQLRGWGVRLEWRGLAELADPAKLHDTVPVTSVQDQADEIEQTFDILLRRFE